MNMYEPVVAAFEPLWTSQLSIDYDSAAAVLELQLLHSTPSFVTQECHSTTTDCYMTNITDEYTHTKQSWASELVGSRDERRLTCVKRLVGE